MKKQFDFDLKVYEDLLKAVASISKLYSNNDKPFIHPRFIEKLYVHASGARDLSRKDMSFDALLGKDIGVGIKTFIVEKLSTNKSEKIAEFTCNANLGDFKNLTHEQKAIKSAELRNGRVISDANEYDIDLNKSIYHCLIRTRGGAIIHEEPYELIKVEMIKPINVRGAEITEFSADDNGHTYFTDGLSNYCYNKSKNVLYKTFKLNEAKNSDFIELKIFENMFEKILEWTQMTKNVVLTDSSPAEKEFVILPLYSTRSKKPIVEPRSGINQWNAGGRERKFGEAYIPIPAKIRKEHPHFFPHKDQKFKLKLPHGEIILAKVCQDNSKALMSDPNDDLCQWLFRILDPTIETSLKRMQERKPYTYADLEKIGKDSVKIIKSNSLDYDFELQSMPLGSYETFINNELEDGE